MDFLAFARQLSESLSSAGDVETLIEEAETLAQRIKSYKLAVIRLVGGTLDQAVEVFSRLNSRGQSMTPDQMVSALTYSGSTEFSLAERIDSILEALGPSGYSTIPRISVFRAILAVAGEQDIQSARWETLARRIENRLGDAVERAEVALRLGVDFLKNQVGAPLGRLVPYSIQLVLLTAFFNHVPQPSNTQIAALRRWFWASSWNGYFAGANTTQVKNALDEMRGFARGQTVSLTAAEETARPFPDRFDMRSARVRTLILWQLAELPALDLQGVRLDVIDIIEKADNDAFRHVVPEAPSNVSNPAKSYCAADTARDICSPGPCRTSRWVAYP